jgi:hypothetical protein
MLMVGRSVGVALFVFVAGCGGGGGGGGSAPDVPHSFVVPPGQYRVFANNDLGMHCMDKEFSTFSILPPFNVFNAQVVYRSPSGLPVVLGPGQVNVTYEPVSDALGSINSTSIGKTDFWAHVNALFGVNLLPGQGVFGLYMPADAPQPGPQPIGFDATLSMFHAFGLPITPKDDAGATNPYPLMRIRARDPATGNVLATTDIVVPVSGETDCRNCHVTGQIAANDPGVPWSTNPDTELQSKLNVLILHDLRANTDLVNQQPVLCAKCHYSPPLDLAGSGPPPGSYSAQSAGPQTGIHPVHVPKAMSRVMHSFHGQLVDRHGQPVFPPGGTPLQTCYQCHPGAITECLRGAMFTGGMGCYSCHGDMLATGGAFPLAAGGSIDGTNDGHGRRPWKDLPRCSSCHTGDALSHITGPGTVPSSDGIRLRQAWRTGDQAASPIAPTNLRFAENTNTLFRFSKGHGGLSCEACHGSTHAEWPIADPASNDNVAANELQGHVGAIMECASCHANGTPASTMNGPHGMHNVDSASWVDNHEDFYDASHASCQTCHGTNLLGTVLSRAAADRTFSHDGHTYHLTAGQPVACNTCHSLPH